MIYCVVIYDMKTNEHGGYPQSDLINKQKIPINLRKVVTPKLHCKTGSVQNNWPPF